MEDTSSLLDLCDKVHDFAKQVEKGDRFGLLFLLRAFSFILFNPSGAFRILSVTAQVFRLKAED